MLFIDKLVGRAACYLSLLDRDSPTAVCRVISVIQVLRCQNKQKQSTGFVDVEQKTSCPSFKWFPLMTGGKSSVFIIFAGHDPQLLLDEDVVDDTCSLSSSSAGDVTFPCHVPFPGTRPVGKLGKCPSIDFMAVVRVVTEL